MRSKRIKTGIDEEEFTIEYINKIKMSKPFNISKNFLALILYYEVLKTKL